MQANEFSEPMAINSITFDAVTGTGEETTFYELYVDMGYAAGSELVTVYDTRQSQQPRASRAIARYELHEWIKNQSV